MSELGNDPGASVDEKTRIARIASGIHLAYQRLGNPGSPAVLLIMGVAAQLIHWPDDFCQALVDRDLQVIRFDNRDAGLSTHIADAPPPNLAAALAGDLTSASYTLSHMAADALGLLDVLEIEKAHVVGASMGGQIAQTMAIEYPSRIRSLTCMMSTTGNRAVGQPDPAALRELFSGNPAMSREDVIRQAVHAMRIVGSYAYPSDEREVAVRAALAYDRSHDPAGSARQAIATIASGDRTASLRELHLPTLVIHGLADRMCNVSGGEAIAEAVPGAELMLIEGMGHDLPQDLRPQIAARIADLIQRVKTIPSPVFH